MSVNAKEVEKFSAMADDWWNENGKFAPLHAMNPIRIGFIKDHVLKKFKTFKDLNILDVGCGGGLLAEPLKRLGAKVTAIDASSKAIKVAKDHAKGSGLNIEYLNTTVETLKKKFDVVLCLEVIEHVDDTHDFVKRCLKLLKPNGLIFFSTINRTIKSYLFAIAGAEYIMRYLPRGTHDWNKFVKPSELNKILISNSTRILDIKGMIYNPIKASRWSLSTDVAINYIACATK